MITIGGCPLGVCIVNGEVIFFDLPYYIYKVITTSTEDIRYPEEHHDAPAR